jgi:mono/diheme cytochrome c family protein
VSNKQISIGLTAGLVLVVFGAVGWFFINRGPAANPDNVAQVAQGQLVYAANCAYCHGAKLEGEANWMERKPNGRLPAPPHDASGHTWHHTDQQLFDIVKNGVTPYAGPGYQSDMPAFKGVLSDAEVLAVLAYIKRSWPEEIRDRQREITAQN